MSAADPIGVFDSGVGGVSVLHEIRGALPGEDLIYVADSGHAPYGDRAATYIEDRAFAIMDFLVAQPVKAAVVACNTVTGVAVERLRGRYQLPIVAIEPAVKPAVRSTKTGIVGVLATTVTLESPNLIRLLASYAGGATVLSQPCPGWVDLVERGETEGPGARAAVEAFVRPLIDRGADTLVLGCTHYVFLETLIRNVAGQSVEVVNPAPAVARQLDRRLTAAALRSSMTSGGKDRFFCTGDPATVGAVLTKLWGRPVTAAAVRTGR
jgi:glutamate racemase